MLIRPAWWVAGGSNAEVPGMDRVDGGGTGHKGGGVSGVGWLGRKRGGRRRARCGAVRHTAQARVRIFLDLAVKPSLETRT